VASSPSTVPFCSSCAQAEQPVDTYIYTVVDRGVREDMLDDPAFALHAEVQHIISGTGEIPYPQQPGGERENLVLALLQAPGTSCRLHLDGSLRV